MTQSLAFVADLATKRLRLAPLAPGDAEALRAITDDPAILGNIHFLPRPFTRADAEALIRGDGGGRDCFIGAWRGEELVGVVGAHLRDAARIEIGYWVACARQGRGYASEAVSAVVSLLRRRFPERRIFAECRPENRASWRVLEKLGMRASGEPGERPGRMVLVLS